MGKAHRDGTIERQAQTARKLAPVWTPQRGPQVDAILATWCPILLYGGAKYGGKSDFLLGDYLQDVPTYGEHWQGILFRRSYKQFTEMITRSKQIYPRAGAEWKKGDSEWHFREGSILRFRYLESLDDLENYWGHCVAKGTKILMGDHSHKAIEEIQIGDEVMTLNGSRKVTATHGPQIKPCVRASTKFGSQIHPIDHRILTSEGWVSYASLLDIDSKEFEWKDLESCKLPSVNVLARLFQANSHSPMFDDYAHPYIGQVLQASEESFYEPCELSPLGNYEVYDLTIDEVNHYITDTLFINQNSYPWVGVDEVGEWEDPTAFFRLFTLLRYGSAPIPTKRLRASANPGGAGHAFIKEYFIDPAPGGYKPIYDEMLKKYRMFIPASIDDNVIGLLNDPDYESNMNRAGSPELVKAWRYGLWDIVAGAFYPELKDKHILDYVEIPHWWTKFCCMDWGACGEGDPFWIGWIAVSDGAMIGVPKGSLVVYREWYGKGLPKMTVSQVAPRIIEMERGDNIQYRVAGGDIEQQRGTGTSIYEIFTQYGLHFKRADRRRLDGAQAVRELIVGRDKVPNLYFTKNCPGVFQCLQTLQHDPKNGADCLQSNDDPYDGLRYGVMSRPFVTKEPDPIIKPAGIEQLTFGKALELERRFKQHGRY